MYRAAILSLIALPAAADGFCDSYSLEPIPDLAGGYRFTYRNSETQCSSRQNRDLEADDGFTVHFQIRVETGPESILVTPPEGYFADPDGTTLVEDGETLEILIYPGVG